MTKNTNPALAAKRQALAEVKAQIKAATEQRKAEKALLIMNKAALKAEREKALEVKLATKLEKAQARLAKLLSREVGPVGSKLIKANKRPSKAIVTVGV